MDKDRKVYATDGHDSDGKSRKASKRRIHPCGGKVNTFNHTRYKQSNEEKNCSLL